MRVLIIENCKSVFESVGIQWAEILNPSVRCDGAWQSLVQLSSAQTKIVSDSLLLFLSKTHDILTRNKSEAPIL